MKDWKTTASGLAAAAGFLIPFVGISEEIGHVLGAVGLFLVALFAKDAGSGTGSGN